MKILDLGCGNRKYKSENKEDKVIGVDTEVNSQADIIHDLNKYPYPFQDNEFDVVYSSHCLEHLDNVFDFMKEVHRILKSKGRLIIKVPHFSSATSFASLHHKHYFGCRTFTTSFNEYFEVEKVKLHYCYLTDKWYKKIINSIISSLANLNTYFCERFWCYWVGGFSEIHVELKNKK